MRNLLVLILAVTILSACSKSTSNSSSSAAFLACSMNGIADTFPVSSISANSLGEPYYLHAQDSKSNGVTIPVVKTGPVVVGTFTYTGNSVNDPGLGSEDYYNGIYYDSYWPSISSIGTSTITITSLHNGFADGTFSATVYPYIPYTSNTPFYITKGVFKNVPVAQ